MADYDRYHEPTIRVRVRLENKTGRSAFVAQIATALDVYTRLLTNQPSPGLVTRAHPASVVALAEMMTRDGRFVLSVGNEGSVRSWTRGGRPGPVEIHNSNGVPITALTVITRGNSSLVATGGADGSVRTWRPNNTPGPLTITSGVEGPVR